MNIQATSRFDGPGLDGLAPVGRETVQDRIYRQLRNALIQARFDAGEIFLAGDVAQRMSVSSMPVREALARLVSERAMVASTVKWAAAEEDLKGDPLLEAFGEVTLHLPSGRFVVVPSEEPAQTWEDPTLKAVARMREKMARMRH